MSNDIKNNLADSKFFLIYLKIIISFFLVLILIIALINYKMDPEKVYPSYFKINKSEKLSIIDFTKTVVESDNGIVMKNVPFDKRGAKFKTSMVFIDKNKELFSDGIVKGIISEKIKGLAGFGYDPLFYVPEEGKTFAEMSIEKKNIISHRGLAVKNLTAKLNTYIKTLKKETA